MLGAERGGAAATSGGGIVAEAATWASARMGEAQAQAQAQAEGEARASSHLSSVGCELGAVWVADLCLRNADRLVDLDLK